MSKSTKKVISIVVTILLFALSLVTIVPFIWMFVSSFATNSEIVKITGGIFPAPTTLDNYANIQKTFNFFRLFANSVVIATVKTVLIIYISAVLGYVFSKMHFRGRNILFGAVLSTMMLPWAVTIIPPVRDDGAVRLARHLPFAHRARPGLRLRRVPVPPVHRLDLRRDH